MTVFVTGVNSGGAYLDTEDVSDQVIRNEPTRLVSNNKSEAERATIWKDRMVESMLPVMKLMDEAFDDGFEINSSVGKDFRGKHVMAMIRAIPKWA